MKIPSCGVCTFDRGRGGWLAVVALSVLSWAPLPSAYAADYPLEIIELRSRFPEDVIPVLAPLAGPEGTLVGSGNSLFVRASPERLADIRRALVALDQPPRSLLIQVRQSGSGESSGVAAGARVDESWGRDGSGRVRVGPPGPPGISGGVRAGRRATDRSLSQEVRALDGRPAFVSIGQDSPVPWREVQSDPRGGVTVRQGTAFRSAASGFYVVPRLRGDTVTLDISAGTAVPDRRGGIATSSAESQVRGRLGEWISVGSSVGSGSTTSAGLLYGGQASRRDEGRIELRVLPLD